METNHLQVILEDINSKFNVVIESYNALDRKIDSVHDELKQDISLLDFKIDTVNNHLSKKIDAVAADLKATDERLNSKIDSVEERLTKKIDAVAIDLKAHRTDTEAHGSIYRVKES